MGRETWLVGHRKGIPLRCSRSHRLGSPAPRIGPNHRDPGSRGSRHDSVRHRRGDSRGRDPRRTGQLHRDHRLQWQSHRAPQQRAVQAYGHRRQRTQPDRRALREWRGPDTVLQGFTIAGGSAVFEGGMRNEGSSPTALDCIFKGNSATDRGGGMYNDLANPSVNGCVFLENFAKRWAAECTTTWAWP